MAKQPSAVPAAGVDDRVEITLANGHKIALRIAVDPMTLARLVQVLDRARSRFRQALGFGSRVELRICGVA